MPPSPWPRRHRRRRRTPAAPPTSRLHRPPSPWWHGYRWLWRPLAGSLVLAVLPIVELACLAILLRQAGVAGWDQRASIWLQGPDIEPLTVVGFVTDWLCSWQLLLGLTTVGCLVLAFKRRWLAALSAALMYPLVVAEVALKYWIDEPPASHFLQTRLLFATSHIDIGLANGFPSGHAARIGFAAGWIAVFLAPPRVRGSVLAIVAVLTLFVGWTRIYVGDHSALEIVGGLSLSLAFLLPAWRLLDLAKRQPAR